MKITAILSILAVMLLSGAAMATCRGDGIEQTAASCMPGMVWDEATAMCVEQPTS